MSLISRLTNQYPSANLNPPHGLTEYPKDKRTIPKPLLIAAAVFLVFTAGLSAVLLTKGSSTETDIDEQKAPSRTVSEIKKDSAQSPVSPNQGAQPQKTGDISYSNSALGFNLEGPQNWEKFENVSGALVYYKNPKKDTGPNSVEFQSNVNVTVDLQAKTTSLDTYANLANQLRALAFQNYNLLGSSKEKLGSEAAYIDDYLATVGSVTIRQRQAYTLRDGKVFVLTFTALPEAWDNQLATFDQVRNTFTFTGIVSGAKTAL